MEAIVEYSQESSSYQLYFYGLVLSLLFFLSEETTISFPPEVNLLLKLVSATMLALHLLFILPLFTQFEKLLLLASMIISVVVGHNSDHLTLMFVTCALVFGAKELSAKTLLRVYFKASAVFCIAIVMLALAGVIENKVLLAVSRENIFGDVVDTRSCLGYEWPTDFATHVFFIMMTYWILNNGQLSFLKVAVYLGIFYFMLQVTDSRLGCGCIFLLLICSFILYIIKKLIIEARILR